MSVTGAVITMIVVATVYTGIIFLSRRYNHGGRDPIDPLYSVSQWNPNGWHITSSCRIPPNPGFCVIEGLTGAYQDATRYCAATGTCIDPDTGENVKGTAIPFLAVCGGVPFCGWSECSITFDANAPPGQEAYLKVNLTGTSQATLTNTNQQGASKFFMQRLIVGTAGALQGDQNGTLAQFYYLQDGNIFILCYDNSVVIPVIGTVTALAIQPYNQGNFNLPTIFVLMETMPTTVTSTAIRTPISGIVARKILAFSGEERTKNPGIDVLQAFNQHVQSALWQAAKTYHLICEFN